MSEPQDVRCVPGEPVTVADQQVGFAPEQGPILFQGGEFGTFGQIWIDCPDSEADPEGANQPRIFNPDHVDWNNDIIRADEIPHHPGTLQTLHTERILIYVEQQQSDPPNVDAATFTSRIYILGPPPPLPSEGGYPPYGN